MVSIKRLLLTSSIGAKMYKGRVAATTEMKEKIPAAVEGSSTQITKQPWMKKSIQRRQTKSRFSRRWPVNSTSQQKKGKARSQDSNSHKRMVPYSQQKRLKAYYSNLKRYQTKFPTESGVSTVPPKTANKEQQSNSPVTKVKDKNACSHVSRTENPQPPLTERPRVSSTRDNQSLEKKSKLSAVEKRRYQTVSEYQFIYPGKTTFHCTKESVKQQLRSIYLGPRRQKLLKPTHQSAQMPCNQWEKNKTQRENTKTDASCPIGSEFLRSKHPNTIPHGLTSLMYKINKLVLVNEMETAPPCTPAGFPQSIQLPQQPPPSQSSLLAAVWSRLRSSNGKKASIEMQHMEQESSPNLSLPGATGNMLRASPTSSTKPRPLSAKDSCGKALSKKSGGEDNQNRDSSKEEKPSENMLEASTSSKGGVSHTRNTIAVPTAHPLTSEESMNMEAPPPSACSNNIQCLAEERQWEPFPLTFSQHSAREEKISGTFGHSSSEEKRQVYSLVTAGSKKYKPLSVDTW